MSAIKIHLDAAELAAVERLAKSLGVEPEDIAFAGLNRVMLQADDAEAQKDIQQTRDWRKDNLPLWSDSAGSIHAYESMPDEESRPRRRKT
ncbi:MAG: hypothetical protein PHQ04_10180 [Opitutaceae bacterium]|nr:hypothetical protein [Opitutaceae bacterium]